MVKAKCRKCGISPAKLQAVHIAQCTLLCLNCTVQVSQFHRKACYHLVAPSAEHLPKQLLVFRGHNEVVLHAGHLQFKHYLR